MNFNSANCRLNLDKKIHIDESHKWVIHYTILQEDRNYSLSNEKTLISDY